MALREYCDAQGLQWRVWPVKPGSFTAASVVGPIPDDLRDGWLCFESIREKRRLCPVPPSWEQRSDDELDAMRRAAEPVQAAKAIW